jgi:hypothetical protein
MPMVFDRVAKWFYIACGVLFVGLSAADFNGSSMAIHESRFHTGGRQTVLAGTPKYIREDEWDYQTPDILRQVFRARPFEVEETGLGNHSVGLLGNLPVWHVTTLFRPQFWAFWVLPADYAFAVYWQAKWLLMVTGSFTLLLMITGESWMAIAGSLWLLWSQFTQVCYSWPSMLPEMCGVFCFAVVLGCGRSWGAVLGCAACLVNFAMFAYVPHLVPYVWAGVFLVGAAHRRRPKDYLRYLGAVAIVGAVMGVVYRDTRVAVAGIADTEYPGRRSEDGASFTVTDFASHFFAASENERHYPADLPNICEASGFLWLAPVTLLCFGAMRRLSTQQRWFLGGLWGAFLLIAGWLLLPIPAWLGRYLLLDKVMDARALPALGLLNIAIVILVLSASKAGNGFWWKLGVCLPVVWLGLGHANHYFSGTEVWIATVWVALLGALLLDGRKLGFALAAIVPHMLLFGMFNPLQRGMGAVTDSELFQAVHREPKLLEGKWLVFTEKRPASLFSAVGCDLYNGVRYLPDIDHFALLRARGLDVNALNNLGYFEVRALGAGEHAWARRDEGGTVQLGVNPVDPLVKDLGIRYVAFEKRPGVDVEAGLRGLGSASGFWLYAVR